jgi:GNAT superfamily N-acetyltransferase
MSLVMHDPGAPAVDAIKVRLGRLGADDGQALADYLSSLSEGSRGGFRPHPLSAEVARTLCLRLEDSSSLRFVLRQQDRIVGYFVLDPVPTEHETRRYLKRLVVLEPGRDFLFTASVADALQGRGFASRAMPHLISAAVAAGARSLVLMGGVPATHERALKFCERWGFLRHGGHHAAVFHHDMRLALERGGTGRP